MKPSLRGALPELDLDLLLAVLDALHGAGAVLDVASSAAAGFGGPGGANTKRKLKVRRSRCRSSSWLQQRRDLVLVAGRNQLRRGKFPLQILDDVVAFDVHRTVMHQHRHQAARIDAEKPRLHVLVAGQIDRMRLPRNAFEIEEDAQLLRARRAGEMQHMHALPAEHLAGLDVAVDQLNHENLL